MAPVHTVRLLPVGCRLTTAPDHMESSFEGDMVAKRSITAKEQRTTAAGKERLGGAGGAGGKAGPYRRVVAPSKGDDGGVKPPDDRGLAQRRQSRIREEPAVKQGITYVGMDAHKDSIVLAMSVPGRNGLIEWRIPNEPSAVKKMVQKVEREAPGEVRFCYEAGPCGYALQRQITDAGESSCMVVAPSLIPVKPGDRIKTDRRDARKLTTLFEAGLLTAVEPPGPSDEALRDLCRAREDAKEDVLRCRHRLSKMLIRRALVFTGGKSAWTDRHRAWLKSLQFPNAIDQVVFDDYLLAIEQLEARLKGFDAQLAEAGAKAPYAEAVNALRCFRGIDTVTAVTIVAELYRFERFTSPRDLMGFVGLVPSEDSSGGRTRRGAITKSGNSHVRRVLVEVAWNYRHRPGVASLSKRRAGQPAKVIAIADRAMHRLHRRYTRLTNGGKVAPKAVVAVARELVGFIWAVLFPLATTGTF